MTAIAAIEWMMFAWIITARTWSKFGKLRISPVMLTTSESTTTPTQNQVFSPALNLPDGTCLPPNIPPALANHFRS